MSRDTEQETFYLGRVSCMVSLRKVCLPGTSDCGLIWNNSLRRCNYGKNLEMRSPWVWVGSESNDESP